LEEEKGKSNKVLSNLFSNGEKNIIRELKEKNKIESEENDD
jgi:hypothetical protein